MGEQGFDPKAQLRDALRAWHGTVGEPHPASVMWAMLTECERHDHDLVLRVLERLRIDATDLTGDMDLRGYLRRTQAAEATESGRVVWTEEMRLARNLECAPIIAAIRARRLAIK